MLFIMKQIFYIIFIMLLTTFVACEREYHVAKDGNDLNKGSISSPFLTIQHAANVAKPGDVITVHEGTYREEVSPFHGGLSDKRRITFQAAEGESVTITGAEIIKGWELVQGDVWSVVLPYTYFSNGFNPFANEIAGDWFTDLGRKHHTGCVYINDEWLMEAATKEDLFVGDDDKMPLWYATVEQGETTIYAQFGRLDPNEECVEINVRQTVFYPKRTNVDYITLRGFNICKAAPNWAPPTAEQKGLVGTNWSKGWIIENNKITHSINVGLSLGKYGDEFDNTQDEYNKQGMPPTLSYYIASVERARERDWQKGNIGEHIVRNNEISYCEQAGIVGSMGASWSRIQHNHIHHIYTQRRYSGHEMAAIKFHAPIDMLLEGNRVHDTVLGIWLDWMTQGTRVSSNLFYNNDTDMYIEVNHGPFVVDNNICMSNTSRHLSQGGAYVHNLFACRWSTWEELRYTPYFEPHSTRKVADAQIIAGDDLFYNNIFVGNGKESIEQVEMWGADHRPYFSYGLEVYNHQPKLPKTGGNIYLNGAKPSSGELGVVVADNPMCRVIDKGDEVYLEWKLETMPKAQSANQLVTTELLGKTLVSNAYFENYDATPLIVDRDYFGAKRNAEDPAAGPFESIDSQEIKIWQR